MAYFYRHEHVSQPVRARISVHWCVLFSTNPRLVETGTLYRLARLEETGTLYRLARVVETGTLYRLARLVETGTLYGLARVVETHTHTPGGVDTSTVENAVVFIHPPDDAASNIDLLQCDSTLKYRGGHKRLQEQFEPERI